MDGLTQYILNVVLRLDVANYSYTLLLRPNECPERYLPLLQAKNIRIEEADIAPIGPLRDVQFAFYLRKNREFDAVLVPSNQYPLALRLPAVYVIHDLIYEQFPEQLGRLGWLKRCYLRFVVRTGLRRAQTIVAVSKYTKSEIVRCYGKRFQDKIQVIYEGWEHLKNDQNNESARVDIPFEEYILYVGSSRGHKNLSRLVSAMQLYKHKLPENMGLVIVGNQKMFSSDQLRAMERPLIASNVPGCREVVIDGYNGFLCEAQDTNSLIACMMHMLAIQEKELVEFGKNGRSHVIKHFSEEKIIALYKRKLHEHLLIDNTSPC
jgi:glycosyltransferase involved in cell wall biosynthesis